MVSMCVVSVVNTLLLSESTLLTPNRFYFAPEIFLEKGDFEKRYL